jgi:hypothetical protein
VKRGRGKSGGKDGRVVFTDLKTEPTGIERELKDDLGKFLGDRSNKFH